MHDIHLSNYEIALLSSLLSPKLRKEAFEGARALLGEQVEDAILGTGLDRLRDLRLVHQQSLNSLLSTTERGSINLRRNFERIRDFVDHVTLANQAAQIAA